MSVTLVLEDEVDASRGDVIACGDVHVSDRFDAHVVWMDERPLDPGRVYLLKHGTRTVTAEVDRALATNEIGAATVTTSGPLVFDPYVENRATGCFILIDPATHFTAGAGMVVAAARDYAASPSGAGAAERLAQLARAAPSDAAAVAAVRRVLEEMLA